MRLILAALLVMSGLLKTIGQTYTYDNYGQLIAMATSNCSYYKYQYDSDGNRIAIQKSQINVTPIIQDNTCGRTNQGSITLQPQSGGNYAYIWSNNRTGATVSSLTAGAYTVSITDLSGNNVCVKTYQIRALPMDTVKIHVTDATCHGYADGQAVIDSAGLSVSDYTFRWSTGGVGLAATGLRAGTYHVTVTDHATGCTQILPAIVHDPPSPVLSLATNPLTCAGGRDGFAAVTVSGAVSSYTFLWSDGVTTPVLDNVPAGTYTVIVRTIATGCIAQDTARIPEPTAIAATVSAVASCSDTGTGMISITGTTGGTGPYTCWVNGVPYGSVNTIGELPPDTYLVEIRDANQCVDSMHIVVPSISCATGVPYTDQDADFNVYPSPNNGEFFVAFRNDGHNGYTLKISDAQNKIIRTIQGEVSGPDTVLPVSLTGIAAGIYTVSLHTGMVARSKKIAVVK